MKRNRKPLSLDSVVAHRFKLRAIAGSGGMGEVFRALDEESGEDVALKLLHIDATVLDAERFAREARIMSEIRHPRIVSYVAHGTCETNGPFLAMVWLEGEDLAKRLSRGPLSTGEALLVLRRIAEPLAVLHARGLVHRDLKPSNILLEKGDIDRATILDLGIARRTGPPTHLTAAGKRVGTPEYMSPEQAHGSRMLEASSDVFSLGCILYECLAGQRPFAASEMLTLLSKILLEPPPRLLSLRPGVPKAVEALVGRMLEKDPKKRPQNASALLTELRASFDWEAQKGAFSPTIGRETPELVSILSARFKTPAINEEHEEPETMLRAYGAVVHADSPTSLVATFSNIGTGATDQAAVAARSALWLCASFPDASVALCTGLALVSADLPSGEAMDRASDAVSAENAPRGVVTTDALTASLLDGRFSTSRVGDFLCLVQDASPRSSVRSAVNSAVRSSVRSSVRKLRGRVSPYVGRAKELDRMLEAFAACKEQQRAHAFFITAPPGMGKSRLLEEFVKRLAERGEDMLYVVGDGEPLGRTRPYAMIANALMAPATGALTAETGSAARDTLLRQLSELGERKTTESKRAVDFRFTAGQFERAFLDLLDAECARRPVFFAIEDVHHVDEPSLELLSRALAELSTRPFFLVVFGQTEPLELHPCPIRGPVEQLELGPLSREAALEFLNETLGKDIPEAIVSEIVERAEGNALFLEELCRGRAEGGQDGAPQSLVAMVQARLGRLHAESRRVLVAASVFGLRFFRGGILSLLNDEWDERAVDRALDALRAAGFIEGRGGGRLAGEEEYGFRQALTREAAYQLLDEGERTIGHARAAAYLEARDFEDAAVLAEHWQRGGNPARARTLHIRAARTAFETNDLKGTRTHAELAAALGAEGAELGIVRAMTAAALFWGREWPLACKAGLDALPLLTKGSAWYCLVLGHLCVITGVGIRGELFPSLFEEIYTTTPDYEATSAYAVSMGRLLCLVSQGLDLEGSEKARARLREIVDLRGAVDANAHGWIRFAMYEYGRSWTQEPTLLLETIEDAVRAFEESGDERMRALSIGHCGEALALLGRTDEALLKLREAVSIATSMAEPYLFMTTRTLLASFLAERRDKDSHAEARELAMALLEEGGLGPFDVAFARGLCARIALRDGDAEEALKETGIALTLLPRFGFRRLYVLSARIRAFSALGRGEQAAALAREVLRTMKSLGLEQVGAFDVDIHIAAAEAFQAVGDLPAFEAELRSALEVIGQQLLDVSSPEDQANLMLHVPANARATRLAREHFGASLVPTE